MTDDTQDNDTQEQSGNDLLDHIESTLTEMHGGTDYDDVDSLDDEAQSIDAREDDDDEQTQAQGEETQGEPEEDEGSDGGTAPAEGEEGETQSETGDLTPEAQEKLDDEMAESFTNERTSARFEHFRTENKRLDSELSDVSAQFEELRTASGTLFEYLEDSNTQPEQLSAQLSINKAINTGDFSEVRPAYDRMKEMMRAVAVGVGDVDAAQVPLSENLQKSVEALDITPELAQQQASMLAQQNLRDRYQRQQYQQQAQQQSATTAKTQAAQAIREWESNLATTDADFKGKQGQILENAQQIMQTMPPEQWLPALQNQYDIISATQARVAAQVQKRAPSPIRPAGSTGIATKREVNSFEDNLAATLREMRPGAG